MTSTATTTAVATKHVVAFGGTGQQGSAFVSALAAYNTSPEAPEYTIHVLVRTPRPASKLPGVTMVVCPDYAAHPLQAFAATGLKHGEVFGVFDVQGYLSDAQDVKQGKAIVDAAATWRVQHFIYASICHDDTLDVGRDGMDAKRAVERHLKATSMAWTTLRDTDFMDNWLPSQRFTLKVYRTMLLRKTFRKRPDAKVAMVSTRDVGRAGAKALHEHERFARKDVVLAGDQLSMKEVVAVYKEVMGTAPTETWGFMATLARWMNPSVAQLTKFYDEKGYNVDLAETKKVLPDVENFRQFLERFKKEHPEYA